MEWEIPMEWEIRDERPSVNRIVSILKKDGSLKAQMVKAFLLVIVFGTLPLFVVFLLLLAVFLTAVASLIKAPFLFSFLHKQGYEWVGWRDAGLIFLYAHSKAFQLLPAAQIEVLPGYQPGARSLANVANQLDAHKQASRQGRENGVCP